MNLKGLCTRIVYTLTPKYLHRDYFKANVYTVWTHGPLGEWRLESRGFSMPARRQYSKAKRSCPPSAQFKAWRVFWRAALSQSLSRNNTVDPETLHPINLNLNPNPEPTSPNLPKPLNSSTLTSHKQKRRWDASTQSAAPKQKMKIAILVARRDNNRVQGDQKRIWRYFLV